MVQSVRRVFLPGPQSTFSGNRQGLPRELLYFRDNQIQFV